MKTCDKRTLETILKYKEYFDCRLVEIASNAQTAIKKLQDSLDILKKENRALSSDLTRAKLNLKSRNEEIERIRSFAKKKAEENDDLLERLNRLEEEIKKSRKEIEEKSKQVDELVRKNNEFYEKLNRKIRRLESSNSTNSNMSTSFDVLSHTKSKANASTRKKSTLKRGGQKGHAAHRSTLSEKPDEIITLLVKRAPAGAAELTDKNGNTYYATQEIDFMMKSRITETRYYECEGGARLDESVMRKYAINSVAYTPHFKAVSVYLNQKGTIPYQRLCEMMDEISGGHIKLRPSTIVSWNDEVHEKSLETRKEILRSMMGHYIMHVDETGANVGGKLCWMQAMTNDRGSYFVITAKRGDRECGPVALLSEYENIVVHDHFRAYQRLEKCIHAECNAHIDRYLKCGIEVDKNKECEEMLELMHGMLARKIELIEQGKEKMEEEEITGYEEKYLEIARRGLKKYYRTHKNYEKKYEPEYVATFKRMIAYRDDHLRFIRDFRVPYTNNAAERQCRIIKTKKKVSGQFVSMAGAEAYADVMTILQTSKIRKENALANLEKIFS